MPSNENEVAPREAARLLGRRYGQVMRLIHSKKLDARKPEGGWGWLITLASIERVKNESH